MTEQDVVSGTLARPSETEEPTRRYEVGESGVVKRWREVCDELESRRRKPAVVALRPPRPDPPPERPRKPPPPLLRAAQAMRTRPAGVVARSRYKWMCLAERRRRPNFPWLRQWHERVMLASGLAGAVMFLFEQPWRLVGVVP